MAARASGALVARRVAREPLAYAFEARSRVTLPVEAESTTRESRLAGHDDGEARVPAVAVEARVPVMCFALWYWLLIWPLERWVHW